MEPVQFKRSSWFVWVAREWGDMCYSHVDICTLRLAVMWGLFKLFGTSVVAAFLGMFLLGVSIACPILCIFWSWNLWIPASAQYDTIDSVIFIGWLMWGFYGAGALKVLVNKLYRDYINRKKQFKPQYTPLSFVTQAWRSWRDKVCYEVEIVGVEHDYDTERFN